MRTVLAILLATLLLAGCTRLPEPLAGRASEAASPAASAALTADPTPSSGAPVPDGWAIHVMANVGHTIARPSNWVDALDIDEADRRRILAADPHAAEHMSISPTRLLPGRDVGMIAFDRTTGTSMMVRLDGGLKVGVDPYDTYLARRDGLGPEVLLRSSMGPTTVAGHPAAVIDIAYVSGEGTDRALYLTGFFGARGQPVEVSFRGLLETFDHAEAVAIIGSIADGPQDPIGKPLVIVEDRELDAVVRGLVDSHEWRVATGDLATLTGLGFPQHEFFTRALKVVPELIADPDRFRGGVGWMASTFDVGLPTVHAVRVVGDAVPDWNPLIAAVSEMAARFGAVRNTDDGEVRWWRADDGESIALVTRGTTIFLLMGTDRELIDSMIGRLR